MGPLYGRHLGQYGLSAAVEQSIRRHYYAPRGSTYLRGPVVPATAGTVTSLTGSVADVRFGEWQPTDRGEHWTQPYAAPLLRGPTYGDTAHHDDSVQVVTDLGLTVVFVGVCTAWKLWH
jgi:hypothetical protein